MVCALPTAQPRDRSCTQTLLHTSKMYLLQQAGGRVPADCKLHARQVSSAAAGVLWVHPQPHTRPPQVVCPLVDAAKVCRAGGRRKGGWSPRRGQWGCSGGLAATAEALPCMYDCSLHGPAPAHLWPAAPRCAAGQGWPAEPPAAAAAAALPPLPLPPQRPSPCCCAASALRHLCGPPFLTPLQPHRRCSRYHVKPAG